MVLQAEAERRKRASILTSEGEKISNINVADAEKQAQILEAEGKSKALILKANAQAESLKLLEEQLRRPSAMKAAQFLIGQKYIEALKRLGRKKNTLVMNVTPQEQEKQSFLNAKFP